MAFPQITTSTLIDRTHKRLQEKNTPFNKDDIGIIIKEFFSVLKRELLKGNLCYFNKLCSLRVKFDRPTRKHPIKGKMVEIKYPPAIVVTTSKTFQEDLKKSKEESK